MGTVHKFTRPPKNENQFKGFRPLGPVVPKRAPRLSQKLRFWRKLRSWHRTLIAWMLLIMVAAAILGVRMLIATVK